MNIHARKEQKQNNKKKSPGKAGIGFEYGVSKRLGPRTKIGLHFSISTKDRLVFGS